MLCHPLFRCPILACKGRERMGVKPHIGWDNGSLGCGLLILSSTVYPQELALGIELSTRSNFSHTLI